MENRFAEDLEVFQKWSLYDIVIHLNYMHHREMNSMLRACAGQVAHRLRVLDLGCGDGRMAIEGLKGLSVESYTGVDLSEEALATARGELPRICRDVKLLHCDLEHVLDQDWKEKPNFIIASYSLHHFPHDSAKRIIQKVSQVLAPRGVFFWIDLQRYEYETRQEYLDRFWRNHLPNWKALDESQKTSVIEHMSKADYPLTSNEKRNLVNNAGLVWRSTPYQTPEYACDIIGFGDPV